MREVGGGGVKREVRLKKKTKKKQVGASQRRLLILNGPSALPGLGVNPQPHSTGVWRFKQNSDWKSGLKTERGSIRHAIKCTEED